MLGDYFHTVITHIEKSDFGTGFIESAGHRETDVTISENEAIQNGSPSTFHAKGGTLSPYGEETRKAILSIFLGARIHDAAVMINISDRTMRDRFLTYCKHTNSDKFERIYERAVHQGYSTPPVELFQPHVLEFFTEKDLPVLHSEAKVSSSAKEMAEEGLAQAKRELSLARIRLSVVEGMSRVLGCE
ncbi:TPA: hypothetical protein ACN36J_004114 [Vibrio parahaemolyticus]